MNLSARNRFKGKVVSVTQGRTTGHFHMANGGTMVHASITNEANGDLAQGRDSYAVAVASGELDPHLEGKQVPVAYVRNGRLLPAPCLVVPRDGHAGCAVRYLVTAEIR